MRSIIALFLLILLVSCATVPLPEPSVENRISDIYLSRKFHPKLLETDGIAVLPLPVKKAPEGIRNNAIFEIQQVLQVYFPKARIVKKDEMVTSMINAGMDRELNRLVKDLSENKTPDRTLLTKIGEIGKVRLLFYAEIKTYEKNSTNSEVIKEVVMEAEILDIRCTDLVAWKGAGSTRVVEDKGIDKIRMEEIFVNATKNLVSSMPVGNKAGNIDEVKGCA